MIQYTINNSPIGKLLIAQSNKGLTHIIFEYQIPQFKFIINKKYPGEKTLRDDKALYNTVQQLNEYFSGNRRSFTTNLDLAMPPFYQKVLIINKTCPYDKTISCHEVAKPSLTPKAVRAAGTANAENPRPIVIPCHRVLATGS